ncbi:SRPBCC domain-containing protein [Runella sp. MFBS21]|uniref:SRPBCC family protein n=1 Tax=Runella sp. MFBS21 TaxID=3034018 RepID=UPI0023F76073|nr:SRPBCC domain-containing protein [Runella sp. MFBS21]MDF7818719.1 SRPBCC domain-containing protein [Runella sp. MFBS21]
MKPNLQFDFLVDKATNAITFRREFLAPRQLVWDAYTKRELLDQWFAPKPFKAKTKSMDFSEGGRWLYAMVAPDGTEYWSISDFLTIKPIDNFTALDGFCDENGVLNPELPRANWDVTFSDKGENALVETVIIYNSLSDLEVVIQMGMEEGLAMTLDNLDEFLLTIQ